jgi:hypothetical protein
LKVVELWGMITMNMMSEACEDTYNLGRFMGMGYQNDLKTDIVPGLKDLHGIFELVFGKLRNHINFLFLQAPW